MASLPSSNPADLVVCVKSLNWFSMCVLCLMWDSNLSPPVNTSHAPPLSHHLLIYSSNKEKPMQTIFKNLRSSNFFTVFHFLCFYAALEYVLWSHWTFTSFEEEEETQSSACRPLRFSVCPWISALLSSDQRTFKDDKQDNFYLKQIYYTA